MALRRPDPRRVARLRVQALAGEIPLARSGDVEGVHRARVASRRLREFLPLLVPGAGAGDRLRPVRRLVRDVTRILGPVRELDVALATLESFADPHPVALQAATIVRASLDTARQEAALQLEVGLTGRVVIEIQQAVLDAARDFGPPAARRTLVRTLSDRLARRLDRAVASVDDAGTVYAADRLHRARIALKKLRYTLELAEACAGLRLRGTLGRLKQAQGVLGDLHDCGVLADHVRTVAAGLAAGRQRTALVQLAARIDETTRHRHGDYVRARPALDTALTWARRVSAGLGERP